MRDGLHVDDDGNKYWFLDDKFHRVDGPAIEYADGGKHWFIEGIYYHSLLITFGVLVSID